MLIAAVGEKSQACAEVPPFEKRRAGHPASDGKWKRLRVPLPENTREAADFTFPGLFPVIARALPG